ncbi:hypothetical protein [Jeongeupia chitinilytica]|nr:hypothetical protein [Jeongeupia chitinilytica]
MIGALALNCSFGMAELEALDLAGLLFWNALIKETLDECTGPG